MGLLGCGSISADHLAGWERCPGASVIALCDPRLERAEARGIEFGIKRVYGEARRMFEAEHLDLVDIVTPKDTHADLIRLAAEFGVNVLCEKPLAVGYAQAEALLREVRDSIRIMVNENWRYRDYLKQIRAWLQEGRLGTVVQARIGVWRSGMLRRNDGIVPALQHQPSLAREQRLLTAELLIDQLDVVRSLFGEVEIVAATMGRASYDVVGEDCAVVLLQTTYGLTITVDGVWSAAGYASQTPDRIEIAGTRCSVILEGGELRLIGAIEERHTYDETATRRGSFDVSIQHFVEQIVNGGPFWTSASDQLSTLRLLDQTYALAGETCPISPHTLPTNLLPSESCDPGTGS